MYARSDSVTLTVQQESFACSRTAARSTQPEVFTFERIPAQVNAVPSYVPIRPKKRATRVMYPAKVRMHLPPPEKNQAKRWLVVLCLVVLWQIYTEEPCVDAPLSGSGSDASISDYHGFQFQSASEGAAAAASSCDISHSSELMSPDTTCVQSGEDAENNRPFEQSGAGNSYMVALLVYHRLGSDN